MVRRVSIFAGWLIALFATAALHGGETDGPWVRGIFTGNSPRPVLLQESLAWQRATELTENTPGAFVLVGSGESMQPLYMPGTILVMQQCPYEKLKHGQTTLYRNQHGKVVAHVLIAKARDGWRTSGLNNPIHDMEPVVPENLVGVVIAAFLPAPAGKHRQVAVR